MNTKWEGLWEQERSSVYAGKVINKKEIPQYTRIVLRENKYYEEGSGRPKYVYCFADSEGYKDKCVPVEYEETLQSKVDELAGVMRMGQENADEVMLPSESQRIARELMQEAISIIEDITGEKWDFSFWTFG